MFILNHHFIKSEGKWRLVPLFVPIGVCVTTHGGGTTSGGIIGMWRHNQEATNHERNGKSWFSLLACNLHVMLCRWMNDITKICTSDTMKLEEITLLQI